MAKPRDVVGVDLSLTSTGIATPSNVRVITPKNKGVPRLVQIRNELLEAIAEEATGNPLIVIEGYSFAQRNSNAHSLGELGGVVKTALYEAGMDWAIVPPTVRAKFATGRGNASKAEVVSAVSARTGITWTGKGADDKCDAWILREMGLQYLGQGKREWPKAQMAALDSVEWAG